MNNNSVNTYTISIITIAILTSTIFLYYFFSLAQKTAIEREIQTRQQEIKHVLKHQNEEKTLHLSSNRQSFLGESDYLYQKILFGSILMGLFWIGICFGLIKLIYHKREREIDLKLSNLDEVITTLSSIHSQLEQKQRKLMDHEVNQKSQSTKKRLITYQKDKIITIDTSKIVYIVLNRGIVSIITNQGNIYPFTSSLDEIIKGLDSKIYYRVNRQYIININAIENIWIYGQNQLRLEISDKTTDPIVISKNKVSEFKKWLDQ